MNNHLYSVRYIEKINEKTNNQTIDPCKEIVNDTYIKFLQKTASDGFLSEAEYARELSDYIKEVYQIDINHPK